MDFVEAASFGNGALLKYIFKRYGVGAFPATWPKWSSCAGKPFSGFATENMFSAVLANGPYAARVRLVPAEATPGASKDWNATSAPAWPSALHWDLQRSRPRVR